MACYYEVYADIDIVKIIYSGFPCVGDVVGLLDRMDIDPAYHRNIDEIVYFDDIRTPVIDYKLLDNICELISGVFLMHNRSKRLALVAGREPGRTMASRFQSVMARNPALSVRLCDTAEEAMRFLGRSDTRLRHAGQECSGR